MVAVSLKKKCASGHDGNVFVDCSTIAVEESEGIRKTLKARGWDDAYMDSDAFAGFLKADQVRVKDVLTSVGLVK